MNNDLDMNSNRIINLPSATDANEPLTYGQYTAGAATVDLTGTVVSEEQVATAGQSVFTFAAITYTQGSKNLSVYRNGVRLPISSYVETSTSSITLNATDALAVEAGDQFEFVVNERDVSTDMVLDSNVQYTPAGSGAVVSDVRTKLRESVSVKDFGAIGDGVTDDTAAIQAAFAASIEVYFPSGSYLTSSPVKLGDGNARRVYGASRYSTKIENSTSDVFKIETNDAGYLHMSDLHIRSQSGGGHCFKISTNSSVMSFDNLELRQDNADKSIWDQQGGYSGNVSWNQIRCYANSTSNLTAHPFNIESTDIVNGWSFKNMRCEKTLGTLQFFNLNTANASSFVTNCSFENITFQEPYGGWIKLGGCRGVEIKNCASYDMTAAQTGHGIQIGASTGGQISSRCKISHCGRYPSTGGTLDTGISDIQLDSGAAANTIIESCFNSAAGATFTVDYANNKCLHIDRPSDSEASYTDSSNVRYIDINGDYEGMLMPEYFFDENAHSIQIGTGTPESAVTAGVGSVFLRTDGGASTTFYIKESGTGNTGWVAK